MRTITKAIVTLALTICLGALSVKASDPLWVKASDHKLNSKVHNPTYTMHTLHAWNPSEAMINKERDYALTKYVEESYNAIPSSIRIDSVSGGLQPVYWVNFNTASRDNNFITAKLVEQYSKFDDYDINVFQYEFYYLFAISNLNEYPAYDEFIIERPSNSKATAMSIIPGLGQFYKGQNTKGYLILGGEIGFALATVIFENKRVYSWDKYHNPHENYHSSWRSKAISYRNFRNGAIGCMAALYIYNLIDAATSKGGTNFYIKKVPSNLSIIPDVGIDYAGLAVSWRF